MNLQGKRVVITGGSSGIGHEIARQLARKGARLVLTGRGRRPSRPPSRT
jgi:NAD(P)-dependent dehydrogenase (short-subunit alcohol dehydrogenase family)